MNGHIFWITSRSAGTAALMVASLSLGIGLAMSRRGRSGASTTDPSTTGDYRAVHEALSLTALALIALHGLALLGDKFMHPGVAGIVVPGAGPYRPFWTGVGIVGGYGLAALGLSYYFRARIGAARWRRLHTLTGVFWILGVAHSLGAGSDAWQAWFLLVVGATVLPGAVLLLSRTGQRLGDALDLPRSQPPVRDAGAYRHRGYR
jgi:sulfoxide reductase heme-binding subunit YedZ